MGGAGRTDTTHGWSGPGAHGLGGGSQREQGRMGETIDPIRAKTGRPGGTTQDYDIAVAMNLVRGDAVWRRCKNYH